MALKKVCVALLLTAGIASAFSTPIVVQNREAVRIAPQEKKAELAVQREIKRADLPPQHHEEHSQGEGQTPAHNGPVVVPDQTRKPAKLTPEELRALRRQINEVGQDIYSTKR